MKILSLRANFGKLDNQSMEFNKALSIINLPNEGGKTTWCSFIRIMLFSLDRSKRDTKTYISDKTKYLPHGNLPMSGVMRVERNQRVIVIERSTDKYGPMQAFNAYYEDTGKPCDLFSKKDCGEILTGLNLDNFNNCAYINGTDMTISNPNELEDTLLSLSQTGDNGSNYNSAVRALSRLQLDIKTANGYGTLSEIQNQLNEQNSKLTKINALECEMQSLNEEISNVDISYDQKSKQLKDLETEHSKNILKHKNEADILKQQYQDNIDRLNQGLPDDQTIACAVSALDECQALLKEKEQTRDEMSEIDRQFEEKFKDLYLNANDDSLNNKDFYQRILLCSSSVILFVLSIIMFRFMAPSLLPILPLAVSIAVLIFTFVQPSEKKESINNEQQNQYDALTQTKRRKHERYDEIHANAEESLNVLIGICKELNPECHDFDRCLKEIFRVQQVKEMLDEQIIKRNQLDALSVRKDYDAKIHADELEISTLRHIVSNISKKRENMVRQIANLQGQKFAVGVKDDIKSSCCQLKSRYDEHLRRYNVLALAKKYLSEANEALSTELSPKINALCGGYLSILTDNKYNNVYIRNQFNPALSCQNTILDTLRLSAGTKDQLYLALRLAVCKVLTPEDKSFPIILDDAFMSYDEVRTNAALSLLKDISKTRQVIIFTCRPLYLGGDVCD